MTEEPDEGEAEAEDRCPTCGADLAPAERANHLAGLDHKRLACARQDIAAIKAHRRPAWEQPW